MCTDDTEPQYKSIVFLKLSQMGRLKKKKTKHCLFIMCFLFIITRTLYISSLIVVMMFLYRLIAIFLKASKFMC